MSILFTLIGFFLFSAAGVTEAQRCVPRQYEYSSVVCVCNSSYCDTVDPVTEEQITGGSAKHYVSTMAGSRLQPMIMRFNEAQGNSTATVNYSLNRSATYQKVVGFGGALTDAVALTVATLSSRAQDMLLRSYFGSEGIGYSLLRMPIGGTDFSTRYYSLDDVEGDTTLEHFNLTEEDYMYKIPFAKRIQGLSQTPVRLFATAWSAPDWMKDIGENIGFSTLKRQYYQLWSQYFIKFLDAYAKENVTFWAITPQNEPNHGTIIHSKFNNMGWTADDQLSWIANNLIPELQQHKYTDVMLMLFDDQRSYLQDWMDVQLANKTVRDYASGIAIHWYADILAAASVMDTVQLQYPEKFLLYTESSIEHIGNIKAVRLGSWERGQQYISRIIEVSNHWVAGWVDWNLALNEEGGPNWSNNTVDAAVIVNATADEFYKQPIFYALAHVSSFVTPGSVRIGLETPANTDVQSVAFLTPDNVTVVIFHNPYGAAVSAAINDPDKGSLSLTIAGNSINTILYK